MNMPGLIAMVDKLCRSFHEQDREGITDAQLLESYVGDRDEAAFTALVRRHGPMVWGVCRRRLRRLHDAEDAYQATFLILARKAASIWPRNQVGPWLHGVAFHVARKAEEAAKRHAAREKFLVDMREIPDRTGSGPFELRLLLDRELHALPAQSRTVLVLC